MGCGNSTKSEVKHGFGKTDVESIFNGPVLFAGRIVEPEHEEERYLLLGITASGRCAARSLLAAETSCGRSAVAQ